MTAGRPFRRHHALVVAGLLAATSTTTRAEEVPAVALEAAAAERPPTITVSKASDGLGAPIALRPRLSATASGAGGIIDRPSGLPVAARALTSRFGMRTHPVLGGRRMHSGVDLAAPNGSPVSAPAAGVVTFANWGGGYGLLVAVDHGNGVQTRFAHLSRLMVSAGQRVTRGQLLGLVGSTGRSTGAHLHYELRHNGRAVDPLSSR